MERSDFFVSASVSMLWVKYKRASTSKTLVVHFDYFNIPPIFLFLILEPSGWTYLGETLQSSNIQTQAVHEEG